MAVAWSVLKAQLGRKLDDSEHTKYSELTLMDAVNDALAAFASAHTGVASDHTITGDGTTFEFDLPSDIIEEEGAGVYAVLWKENTWLARLEYWAGTAWPYTSRTTSSTPLGFILWPQGKISFSRVPASAQAVIVNYVGYYPEVTDDETDITVPRWALEPIKLYSAAVALEPTSTATGDLRRWNTKRDSGQPDDNPVLCLARHYLKRYYDILAAHQPPQYVKLPALE